MITAAVLLFMLQMNVPDAASFVGQPKGQPVAGAELDRRTHEVGSLVRCPVCQGMSVADSPSEMAVNMKGQVRDLLARGYTEEQILEYFELSYGQFVLLRPKFEGVTAAVWVIPILALVIGIAVTVVILKRLARQPVAAPTIEEADPAEEAVPANPFFASAMKGFAWGMATFAVLGALGYMVVTKATPRSAEPAASVPATAQAAAAAPADPLDVAQKELERDNLMAVFEQTKIVLEKDPENSRALTLQAMVWAAMNDGDRATDMLGRAVKSDPGNLDARVALAWVYARNGKMSAAETTIATAIKDVPSEKALLEKVLQQIKTPR